MTLRSGRDGGVSGAEPGTLLLMRVEGLPGNKLATLDLPAWVTQRGLARQLSPSRSNGLHAVQQRMRGLVAS